MKTTVKVQADEVVPQLGELLVRNAQDSCGRAAAQALAEDGILLKLDHVRTALVSKRDGRMTADWRRLMRRLNTLGLDEEQRLFLTLIMSIAGVGCISLSTFKDLEERRLRIIQEAFTRLARIG